MSLNLITDTNDPQQNGLLVSFTNPSRQTDDNQFVRNDKSLAFKIQPVVASDNAALPWSPDHLSSDTYQVAIGLTDDPPTSGDWPISIGAQNVTGIAWDVLASSLQTSLSTAWVAAGYSTVAVTLLSPQTFKVKATANGAVPSMTTTATNNLLPDSVVSIVVEQAGSGSTPAIQIVQLRQTPVAYATPTTQLPAASVTATVKQSGSSTKNKIYNLTFTDGTYGGGYSVDVTVASVTQTVGVLTFGMTSDEVEAILQNYTGSTADDFAVTISDGGQVTIEFKGAYALSNGPAIAVTNINLLAPQGISGFIDLNTFSLNNAFYTTQAEQLTYVFAIRRTRASGEDKEFYQRPITLKRNIIDLATMVPVLLPNYITQALADTLYVAKAGGEVTGDLQVDGVFKPNGGIQTSGDSEWVDSLGTIKLTSDGMGIKNVDGDVFINHDGDFLNASGGKVINSNGVIALKAYTVATLPTGVQGDRAYVTDATVPTYNSVLVGGGAIKVPVFRNATVWVSA